MNSTDVAAAALGGVFGLLGDLAVRWPLLVVGFWIALAAVSRLVFPSLANVAAQNLPEILSDTAPVEVTSGQSGGAQTRMTLRQTFTGRHSYRGRHRHAHSLPRPGVLAVSKGVRQTAVAGANCQQKQSTPDVLENKFGRDMAINDEAPAAEQEVINTLNFATQTADSRHSVNSAIGPRRTQVSNTNGKEERMHITSSSVKRTAGALALALSVVSAAFGLTGCGSHRSMPVQGAATGIGHTIQ